MWLISTNTHQLEFFADEHTVQYAILSHRWTHGEVLHNDIRLQDELEEEDADRSLGRRWRAVQERAGWTKILRACQEAVAQNLQYLWVDTCTIDKASSSELSEAINSMYRWYQNAAVCLVYLHDVAGAGDESNFESSVWFSRGWTLQELIAPPKLRFYDEEWKFLGTRNELSKSIATVTGIAEKVLTGAKPLTDFSVAQRMSWAAGRQTTRPEDRAYSLLGIFGVNLPMLYGEGGQRAFLRLQEEIIRVSNDHTIFAWKLEDPTQYHGLLATSPDSFAKCGGIERAFDANPTAFHLTNVGLQIQLVVRHHHLDLFLAALNCIDMDRKGKRVRVGIFLGPPDSTSLSTQVGRCALADKDRIRDRAPFPVTPNAQASIVQPLGTSHVFSVLRDPLPLYYGLSERHFGFHVRNFEIGNAALSSYENHQIGVVARPGTWDDKTRVLTLEEGTNGLAMGFVYNGLYGLRLVAGVGFDANTFQPKLWLADTSDIVTLRVAGPKTRCISDGEMATRLLDDPQKHNRDFTAVLEDEARKQYAKKRGHVATAASFSYWQGEPVEFNKHVLLLHKGASEHATGRIWTISLEPEEDSDSMGFGVFD